MSRRPDDLYPRTPDEDIAALRREQEWRDNELADLPDPMSEEEYEAANEAWLQWQLDDYREVVGRPK